MCSLSLIRPASGILRIVMHRDEADTRPDSLPPVLRSCGSMPAIVTVDAHAGGAWIGANAAGLVVGLLNHTASSAPHQDPGLSRGMVVPALLAATDPHAAETQLTKLPLDQFAPFTVVVATTATDWAMRWDGCELRRLPDSPVRCSSGLGDDLVDEPRRQAWTALVGTQTTAAGQDAWHASRIGSDPAAWVLMRRPGARTVSRTLVEVGGAEVTLSESLLKADGQVSRYSTRRLCRSPEFFS